MPHHELAKRPDVAKIKPIPGKTTSYSDPSLKSDPDARGIRLMVGATTKTWVITRRIDDKVRTITLGSFPDLPTIFDARDAAKAKMTVVAVRSMLARVAKLEAGRGSPALAYLGSDEFEAQVCAECAAGKLDARDWLDERGVLAALQRWSADKVWLSWQG